MTFRIRPKHATFRGQLRPCSTASAGLNRALRNIFFQHQKSKQIRAAVCFDRTGGENGLRVKSSGALD